MALEIDEVAGLVLIARRVAWVLGMKEVVEADFEQGGQRRICRDMAADARVLLVLAVDHGHRVPANEAFDAALHLAVAGVRYFIMFGDGIEVGSSDFAGGVDACFACSLPQDGHELCCLLGAFVDDDLIECLNPLCNFFGKVRRGGNCQFHSHRIFQG